MEFLSPPCTTWASTTLLTTKGNNSFVVILTRATRVLVFLSLITHSLTAKFTLNPILRRSATLSKLWASSETYCTSLSVRAFLELVCKTIVPTPATSSSQSSPRWTICYTNYSKSWNRLLSLVMRFEQPLSTNHTSSILSSFSPIAMKRWLVVWRGEFARRFQPHWPPSPSLCYTNIMTYYAYMFYNFSIVYETCLIYFLSWI